MNGILNLKDGTKIEGKSFGSEQSSSGEVVFSTGMVGYPEAITDPSYKGQILVLTYPLIGNYGVPPRKYWESEKIQISGLIVSTYVDTPSHHQSVITLSQWLKNEKIPALEIKDTRFLTQEIRTKGSMLGKMIFKKDVEWFDPDKENLVERVSIKKPRTFGKGRIKIAIIDCGGKHNVIREFVKRKVQVTEFPWNYDFFSEKRDFDAILISNGPGNPKRVTAPIQLVQKALSKKIPVMGICMGNQLLTLAADGDTAKLKYGHRSQNQPCILEGTDKCFLTTQNHGYVVSKIPKGFKTWFRNVNDDTNEGIYHEKYPFMSVQFHPEASPGPEDTDWIFDKFLKTIK